MADKRENWVHVVGTGAIGEPIIYLLLELQKELEIDTISFHKKTPLPDDVPKVKDLMEAGARLVVDQDKYGEFIALGIIPYSVHEAALESADVIIDCTPEGNNLKVKYYRKLAKKYPAKGFIAQASEVGFGIPYAWNINDPILIKFTGSFIRIVSSDNCNLLRIPGLLDKKSPKWKEHIVYDNFFMPGFTNTILSSIAATLWLLEPYTYKEKMKVFDKFLFDEI